MILKQHSPTWLTDRPEMRERIEALLPYTGKLFVLDCPTVDLNFQVCSISDTNSS